MFFKEVNDLICQAEKSVEVTNIEKVEAAEATTGTETFTQEDVRNIDRPLKSIKVQTSPVEYFGRSQSTQTKENTKTTKTKGTQTCMTSDLLSNYFKSKPKMISVCLQTDPVNLQLCYKPR